MILLGCLLVFGLAVAPRVFLVLAWIFSERWPIVWSGDWLVPLLGIIFLPYTTIMYMLVWMPMGIDGWDWLWIVLGLFLDVTHWAQSAARRKDVPGYATATAAVSGSGSSSPPPPTTKPPTTAPAATKPPATPPAAAPPVTGSEVDPPE
jgi:hypothetical protein